MMNQEDLFKKIGLILSELQEQYQFLAQNPQNLNELELELFLANANFLTDHVQIVRKANHAAAAKAQPEPGVQREEVIAEQPLAVPAKTEEAEEIPVAAQEEEEPVIVHQPREEEPVIVPPKAAVLNEEIFKLDKDPATFEFILSEHPVSDKFEFEEKEVGDIFDRPLSEEEQRIIAQKQKLREKKEEETVTPEEEDELGPEPFLVEHGEEMDEEIPAQNIVETPASPVKESVQQQDLFKEDIAEIDQRPVQNTIPDAPVKPTLNELLGGGMKSEPNKAEVADLKQAISLNDKLLYIKDLFNGYNLAYAEVIDLVNKMPDFKTADTFLQNNYAVKNDWKSKQATVDRFYELLNRRFPVK
ncbi:hypothetical protein [Pedobacter sp.]|jgi:hypothetical protein|uniref:hypothetical protein n=1 Tax=Pedobacter sp. TaxID=1411316 RepID=UPI002C32FA9F|nr:hypothetical protein [Pedobacter sp.]HWW42381.1 hypothetical protein [Pedobacter sp.]